MTKFLSTMMFIIAAVTFSINFMLDPTAWHFGATALSIGALLKVTVQFYIGDE